jgi:hypothetical protein
MKVTTAPVGSPWLWTRAFGPHKGTRLRANARDTHSRCRAQLIKCLLNCASEVKMVTRNESYLGELILKAMLSR